MPSHVYVRVTVGWRMPLSEDVPEPLRGLWLERWSGATWHEGRLLTIPAGLWRWIRRTQGDYLERCFQRAEGFGRTYLRAVPCPRSAPPPALPAAAPAPPAKVTVRRCGCGRR